VQFAKNALEHKPDDQANDQVKSSQLYLGRVALSAIGWYQKGPCVNYDYTIKIKKLKITLKQYVHVQGF